MNPSADRTPVRKRLAILGSTGSIGTSTLDVVERLPDRFQTVGLVARSGVDKLLEQAERIRPEWIGLTDPSAAQEARERYRGPAQLLDDPDKIARRAAEPGVDIVVSAIVGSAGLTGTWAAIEAGKTVALANKETMVVAGALVSDLARRSGGTILPVDSEHSAIFQAIQGNRSPIDRVVLTGSGGPFRGKLAADLQYVTVEQALRHPTWKMGPKITVDSATLMNKALEVIEARWLFDLSADRIAVIIHPESMIHSFVEFVDGSVLAQISPPDMRLPIQYALTYPERLPCPARRVNWTELASFRFEQPDRVTFPALDMGFETARRGGTAGAVLNAANETAVEQFLAGEVGFPDISRCCRAVLDAHDFDPSPSLSGLWAADRRAREEVRRWTKVNSRR